MRHVGAVDGASIAITNIDTKFTIVRYLGRVADAERDDGSAVGVCLEVRVTALSDAREQVARLVYQGCGGAAAAAVAVKDMHTS